MPARFSLDTEMTAPEARAALVSLTAMRLDLADAGVAADDERMTELAEDIAETRELYVLLALTEMASLRSQLSGVQSG